MHANSNYGVEPSRYFSVSNFSSHEGAANTSWNVSDNGFLSHLWPDGVSETDHLYSFDESANFANSADRNYVVPSFSLTSS